MKKPFVKKLLLRLVALQALEGGPFQSFQHKGAEVIPNTNGEAHDYYQVCVGRQILPMHRNQLQLVAVPKVDTWICINKKRGGRSPVWVGPVWGWGWEFPSFPSNSPLQPVTQLQQLTVKVREFIGALVETMARASTRYGAQVRVL